MTEMRTEFIKEAKKGMADTVLRQQMQSYLSQYQHAFQKSVRQFAHLDLAKMRAARLRWRTINHLDKYLIELESNFIKSGAKVIWAQDMEEASLEIINILKKNNSHTVTTCTDSISEELSIGNLLKQEQWQLIETNYSHLIRRSAGELVPSFSATNSTEISYRLKEALQQSGLQEKNDPEKIALFIRENLRKEFTLANASITTAQFLAADPGAVIISDNDGAALLTAGMPRINIVLAPIDRIVPSLPEIELLLSLFSTYNDGKPQHTYSTIITGPRTANDKDGPEELYIVLIDNGRSNVLAYEPQRKILSCINCNACLPASAIYKTVGGKSFPGPAKAISVPLAFGAEKYKYLADLATMDGSGSETCPVKISFPRLTLENRRLFVKQGHGTRLERWFYFAWKKTMLNRNLLSWTGIDARKKVMEAYFKKSSEQLRSWPDQPVKFFNQRWREKTGSR